MSRHCDGCNEEHLMSEFYETIKTAKLADNSIKIYQIYNCKKIANEYRIKNISVTKAKKFATRQTVDGMINHLVNGKKKHNKSFGQPCDLDAEYLKLLIKNQNSKCIYCCHNLIIMSNTNKFNQISIDRIDSNRLYFKDNIQITCLFCNYGKNDSSDSAYKQFIGALKGTQINFEYTEKKYVITTLANTCRKLDRRKNFNLDNTIKSAQIKELLLKQNNKCAISGISFVNSAERNFPLCMSVDRLNSALGHTFENCQIVCLAVNYAKLNKSNDETIQYIKEIMQSY